MKALLTAVLLATLTTGSASAQVLDLSTVKCKEFVASGNENITLVMMWLTGYYADQDASPLVDFTKMKSDATKIGEYCATNPDNSIITAAEEVMQ